MAIVTYYDTNGVPQPVDVTDGSVHVLLTGEDGSPLTADESIPVNLAMKTVTGTLGALNAELCLEAHTEAMGTLVFQVSGTWKGKIVIEGAVDGTYNNLSIVQPSGTIAFTGVNNDNQNGVYRALLIAGYTHVRLRMSSYTSGTATVVMNAAPLVPTTYAWQLNPANLNMQMQQIVTADTNNSSDENLDNGNGYTFTGAATSTLGVAGIQVSLFADQNCTVSVQQSPDDTPHWDLVDNYNYYANENFGITVQAVSSYVRVVVTTTSLTTTTFRLQTALCPVVEAVPRSLDSNGNFKVAVPVNV